MSGGLEYCALVVHKLSMHRCTLPARMSQATFSKVESCRGPCFVPRLAQLMSMPLVKLNEGSSAKWFPRDEQTETQQNLPRKIFEMLDVPLAHINVRMCRAEVDQYVQGGARPFCNHQSGRGRNPTSRHFHRSTTSGGHGMPSRFG